MPAGRPTKYNEDMQKKADSYIDGTYLAVEEETGKEVEKFNYSLNGNIIPSVEGLAKYMGVSRSTVYLWAEKHSDFSDTLDRIESEQKLVTLNGGLKGIYNATIAKLVLANHGMHDKQDTTHAAPGGGPIKTEWNLTPVKSNGSKD